MVLPEDEGTARSYTGGRALLDNGQTDGVLGCFNNTLCAEGTRSKEADERCGGSRKRRKGSGWRHGEEV